MMNQNDDNMSYNRDDIQHAYDLYMFYVLINDARKQIALQEYMSRCCFTFDMLGYSICNNWR